MKGSDASGMQNNEPLPSEHVDFSDDEEEARVIRESRQSKVNTQFLMEKKERNNTADLNKAIFKAQSKVQSKGRKSNCILPHEAAVVGCLKNLVQ